MLEVVAPNFDSTWESPRDLITGLGSDNWLIPEFQIGLDWGTPWEPGDSNVQPALSTTALRFTVEHSKSMGGAAASETPDRSHPRCSVLGELRAESVPFLWHPAC